MNKETYEELIVPYSNALRIVRAHIENIQQELLVSQTIRNPIDSVYGRIKSLESIEEKCQRPHYNVDFNNIDEIKEKILDIAGVRITCLYKDDLFIIKSYLERIPGIFIQEVKDYTKKPKDNGYQSLHLKTKIEISSITHGALKVPVEIQIRTLNMQEWAQVEHRARYKAPIHTNIPPDPELDKLLLEAATLSARIDDVYIEIRKKSGES